MSLGDFVILANAARAATATAVSKADTMKRIDAAIRAAAKDGSSYIRFTIPFYMPVVDLETIRLTLIDRGYDVSVSLGRPTIFRIAW